MDAGRVGAVGALKGFPGGMGMLLLLPWPTAWLWAGQDEGRMVPRA